MSRYSSNMVSSPNSTGGGGTHFEQHVGAACLAWMLTRAIPPILIDCTVSEVHFQTERLGWKTDDILLVGECDGGSARKLVCQVKQTLSVSSKDTEFVKVISDSWLDFQKPQLFNRSIDRFAIVTLRGTDSLLRHFGGLLNVARTSVSFEDFKGRLDAKGVVHAKVRNYLEEVVSAIESIDSQKVKLEGIWGYLRVLHILSFDFNTPTRHAESQVKSLLAFTACENTAPAKVADVTWTDLLREVGEGKPVAKSYRREDLSDELRTRHSAIASNDQKLLNRLREHSKPILDGIRTTIGPTLELRRDYVIHQILDRLDDSGVILVTGGAGAGKSGIAKRFLENHTKDYFTFVFRAEEFATAHLDKTLSDAQIGLNTVIFKTLLGGQAQKLLLIESVERLLEATTRDAFVDLLTLVANDHSWKIILTCRDYSSDLIRTSLLQLSPIKHALVIVPPFDKGELEAVTVAYPNLVQPLENARLRRLLGNAYTLDKATQILWAADRPFPENERAFREKFWGEIVKANSHTADGMPRRRHAAFVEIALRRSRNLTPYASRQDVDAAACDKLLNDSLLVVSCRTELLVAPAHDVLEDWAIIQWIDEQYALFGDDLNGFSSTIGTYPAVRRGYRKWLSEIAEVQIESAETIFNHCLSQSNMPAHFRDDTLVALLNASSARALLQRYGPQLFADDKLLLKRLIHLLRVGCVTIPPWFEGAAGTELEIRVPNGDSWPALLEMIANRISEFDERDFGLLLGLVKDFSRGVSWHTAYPDGAHFAVVIAHWLLPQFSDYGFRDEQKQVLRIIAALPKCDEAKFRNLVGETNEDQSNDTGRLSKRFQKLILSGLEGQPACRDFPELLIDICRSRILMTEEMLKASKGFHFSQELEAGFGFQTSRNFENSQASAYQGPFFFLLRHHFAAAISFVIEISNHCADWYGQQKVPIQYVEPAEKLVLTFADGSTREQWANVRLWNAYRGTSVAPHILQSVLMALERSLMEVAETEADSIDQVLVQLLRMSESVAITSVAASIATLHPHKCPETLLILLSSPECIQLDRIRMVSEVQSPSHLSEMLPSFADGRVFDRERKTADNSPHRKSDLETAIVNLQLGAHADRVRASIDKHIALISPEGHRNQEDKLWLLSLRRMDLRQYEATDEVANRSSTNDSNEPARRVRMDLRIKDVDLVAMSSEASVQQSQTDMQQNLLMWGIKVFQNDQQSGYDPAQWKARLDESVTVVRNRSAGEPGYFGPEFVAAVCVRDHFHELTESQTSWCINIVCEAIESGADHWNEFARMQRSGMNGDRPCAFVVSSLITKSLNPKLKSRVENALALAVTHANDEVRTYATTGVGRNLWYDDEALAEKCVNGIARQASLVQDAWNNQRSLPYEERKSLDAIERDAAQQIRSDLFSTSDSDAYSRLDVTDWIGSTANCRILAILKSAPDSAFAHAAFQRLANALVSWWDEEDEENGYERRRQSRSQAVEISLPLALEEFVLQVDIAAAAKILAPILNAMDRHPKEIGSIIQGIVDVADRSNLNAKFWELWQLFADRIVTSRWLSRVEERYPDGDSVLAAIFLTQYWREDVRHWHVLDGATPGEYGSKLHNLFVALPPSSRFLDDYVRFLYHIGETCLPNAFVGIASKLVSTNVTIMLQRENTVFMLVSLLRRYIYSRPLELKKTQSLRQGVLSLLDALVDSGSSAAYQMRDDFVTPMSVLDGS